MIKYVLIFALFVPTFQEGCNFYSFDDDTVLLTPNFDLVYPPIENSPDNRNITLPVGATIILSCKGGHFSGDYKTTQTILATCNRNSQLEVQDKILNYESLDCRNYNSHTVNLTTLECAPNSSLIKVGFEVGLNISFVDQVDVCFDTKRLTPVYTHHNLTKAVGFIKSYLTTLYVLDEVFNLDINFTLIYDDVLHQQEEINSQLGLPSDSTQYVDPHSCSPYPPATTPGFCFSRRPLTYRGNFIYIVQQFATYRYITVAPQWYFLDYNLDKLERNIVDFVKLNLLDLEVYTGTYGVLTYPHNSTGEETELYLYDDGENKAVPVPLIFWKLIYDRVTFRATVFLVINNPHLRDEEVQKNVICDDVSEEISWLTWESKNATKGYAYACAYDGAKKAITYLPDLYVNGLLV